MSAHDVESTPAVTEPQTERADLARAMNALEASKARVERDAQRVSDESRAKLVVELLPVLDNLDRTIVAVEASSDPALLEGVRMVRGQLQRVLVGYGLEPIEAAGQPFDPAIHDAISVTPILERAHHNVVVHQAEPGFRFAGKVLRPAKVVVGQLAASRAQP